ATLRRAARRALLAHKRAGNPVATWRDGRVALIPPEEIPVEEAVGGEGSDSAPGAPARATAPDERLSEQPTDEKTVRRLAATPRALVGETFFVTGFPGFIAGRLVERLALEGARFQLLVQPAFAARARADVARISAETGAPPENFRLMEGDITREGLGLSPSDLGEARAAATAVFHLAAVYDLGVARELAVRVNVEGTRNVNLFAKSVRGLRRYHYVSTCYVAGRRTGRILETELRHGAGFRNNYEETKYLAEVEVDALKGELPVTIHRPAVVCGDSRTGETAKYDGVYYLINYLRIFPRALSLANIGNRDVRLNVVPVDFVVEAMAALARDETSAGETVQLADPAPLTTEELFDVISRNLAGRDSLFTLPAPVVRTTLNIPFNERVTGLPRVGVPYFFLKQTYDTARATALLAPSGVRCPRFPDYAPALIDFVERHPRL
ncbi:MAG TPA: SDR family oxidoreductase, partial [Pyrinomonadaceae bacterium]|nr:SDR family oxidoreductase [Pyrinomonadaceae bacterium]